jgi:hypothetical protein
MLMFIKFCNIRQVQGATGALHNMKSVGQLHQRITVKKKEILCQINTFMGTKKRQKHETPTLECRNYKGSMVNREMKG